MLIGIRACAKLQGRVGQDAPDHDENHQCYPDRDVEHLQLIARDRASDIDRRLMSIHSPEVEVAPGKEDETGQRRDGAAPPGKSR